AHRLRGAQFAAPHPQPAGLHLAGQDGGRGRVAPRRPLPSRDRRRAARLLHQRSGGAGPARFAADPGPVLSLPRSRAEPRQDPAASDGGAGDRLQAADPLPGRDRQPLRPPGANERPEGWRSVGEALRGAREGGVDRGLEQLARIGDAYASQDPALFNVGVATFETLVQGERPDAAAHARYEVLFNRAQPFYAGMVIYLLALLAVFASFLWKRDLLQPAAFGLLVAAAFIHTLGLVSRIALQGRPPVTNLYSSAVFVGWS